MLALNANVSVDECLAEELQVYVGIELQAHACTN